MRITFDIEAFLITRSWLNPFLIADFNVKGKRRVFMSQSGDFIVIIKLNSNLISVSIDVRNLVTVFEIVLWSDLWLDLTLIKMMVWQGESVEELSVTEEVNWCDHFEIGFNIQITWYIAKIDYIKEFYRN